ncbi:MAG: UDP-N-acetylmuramoyl-L-alanine--D-glutamate ligase [Tepidisphaeraceae bacterium]
MAKESLHGKRVTVAGLGRFGGGIAAARWLVEQDAKVLVVDGEPAEKLAESVVKLAGLPIEFHLGAEDERDFTSTDLVVTSPALPPAHPCLAAARRAAIPVTTEIALFIERCPTKLTVGVTGTKGKSTTTALLARMLNAASPAGRHANWNPQTSRARPKGNSKESPHPAPAFFSDVGAAHRVFLGGNIGTSLLDQLPNITSNDIVVLELSSYMLHYLGLMRWSPHVAVVTMVGADHVEWHGSPESYLEAKQNIVRYQTEKDFAVVSTDSPASRAFGKLTKGTVIEYGKRANLPAAFAPALVGRHNRINERGAFATARLFGVYADEAAEQVKDFRGLPHRLELVHEASDIRWYNDSIATIPEAAIAANNAFEPGKVIQIVGGYDKHLDMAAMCTALASRCKAVLTIGALGPTLAQKCRDAKPRAAIVECDTLERAVEHARTIATPDDVVLLSTGCASYDQFANFEVRGARFGELREADRQRIWHRRVQTTASHPM